VRLSGEPRVRNHRVPCIPLPIDEGRFRERNRTGSSLKGGEKIVLEFPGRIGARHFGGSDGPIVDLQGAGSTTREYRLHPPDPEDLLSPNTAVTHAFRNAPFRPRRERRHVTPSSRRGRGSLPFRGSEEKLPGPAAGICSVRSG